MISPKEINIHPTTDKDRAIIRLQEYCNYREPGRLIFRQALYTLEYARQTGRINGTTEMGIRALSGYRYAKLVIEMAAKAITADSAAKFLNRRFS